MPKNVDNKYALFIGNYEFRPKSGLSNLLAPKNDIVEFSKVLSDKDIGNFQIKGTLFNKVKQDVLKELNKFFGEAEPEDLLLLYISSHGLVEREETYFATADTEEKLKFETAISSKDLKRYILSSKATRQVIILDCCYSGAFINEFLPKSNAFTPDKYFRLGTDSLGGKSIVFLTASGDAIAYEKENGRSIYTDWLVNGLKSGKADTDEDGVIKANELHNYAAKNLTALNQFQKPQIFTMERGSPPAIVIAKNPHFSPHFDKEVESLLSQLPNTFHAEKRMQALSGLERILLADPPNRIKRDIVDAINPLRFDSYSTIQIMAKSIIDRALAMEKDSYDLSPQLITSSGHLTNETQISLEEPPEDYVMESPTRNSFDLFDGVLIVGLLGLVTFILLLAFSNNPGPVIDLIEEPAVPIMEGNIKSLEKSILTGYGGSQILWNSEINGFVVLKSDGLIRKVKKNESEIGTLLSITDASIIVTQHNGPLWAVVNRSDETLINIYSINENVLQKALRANKPIESIAINENYLFVMDESSTLYVLNLSDYSIYKEVDFPNAVGFKNPLTYQIHTPKNHQRLIISDSYDRVYSYSLAEEDAEMQHISDDRLSDLQDAQLSPNEEQIGIVYGNGMLAIWFIESKSIRVIPTGERALRSLDWAAVNNLVAMSGEEKVIIWDSINWKKLASYDSQNTDIAFDVSTSTLAGVNENDISFWRVNNLNSVAQAY